MTTNLLHKTSMLSTKINSLGLITTVFCKRATMLGFFATLFLCHTISATPLTNFCEVREKATVSDNSTYKFSDGNTKDSKRMRVEKKSRKYKKSKKFYARAKASS